MDKEVAKKREKSLFVKIDNDGYGLGAQRNAVKGGQLSPFPLLRSGRNSCRNRRLPKNN
jgi:type I restriction enzyme M protein